MSRTFIAALTMAAIAACSRGDRSDAAAADSLNRDLQLAPVDTTAELNDRPSDTAVATTPRTPARTPSHPIRPTPSGSSHPTTTTAAPAPTPSAPAASATSLAAGTKLTATTTAEVRSNKNKVGDTVTATIAEDV